MSPMYAGKDSTKFKGHNVDSENMQIKTLEIQVLFFKAKKTKNNKVLKTTIIIF